MAGRGNWRLTAYGIVLIGIVLRGYCKHDDLDYETEIISEIPDTNHGNSDNDVYELPNDKEDSDNVFRPWQKKVPDILVNMARIWGHHPWQVVHDEPSFSDAFDAQTQASNKTKKRCSVTEDGKDFMTETQRKQGGIILHVIIGMYVCAALGVLCDYYFVPSLEIICYHLNIQEDVGGATLMCIGSSAPDIFSGIIAILFVEGDLGVGTVMGTTVFNLLLVVGVMGMAICNDTFTLMWWPASRDMAAYCLSVIALALVVSDGFVTVVESSLLIVLYFIYFFMLWFNRPIEKRVYWLLKDEASMELRFEDAVMKKSLLTDPNAEKEEEEDEEKEDELSERSSVGTVEDYCGYPTDPPDQPFHIPKEPKEAMGWILLFPVKFIFFLTIPDLRRPKCQKLVSVTFITSIIWIGILTFVLLRMVNTFGNTFGLPGNIMGITLVTFGTSVPDLLCSVMVIRRGRADMAMSQCIAANPLGILIGMGVPWLLKITVITHDVLTVARNEMLISCLKTLLLAVLAFIFLVVRKFKLDRKTGIVFLVGYVLYIIAAVCYTVFVTCGDINFLGM